MHVAGPTTEISQQALAQGRPRLLRPWTWGRRAWHCGLAILLLLAATALVFWLYLTAPDRWYQRALAAVERSDREEVDRLVLRLNDRGRHDEAHFVRGKAEVLAGRALNQEAVRAARREQVDQGLGLLLDLGAQFAQPGALRFDVVSQENSVAAPWTEWRPARQQRVELDARIRAAFQSGLKEFTYIREESPLRVEAAALTGDCLFRMGDPRAAAQVLDYVVGQRPDDVEAHRLLAAIYFDLGAMARAEYHAKEIARLDPEDGRPLRLIGSIHKDFRNLEDAAIAYREALSRQLSIAARAEVVRELTELLVEGLGKDAEALATLDQCPPAWRDTPDMWVLRELHLAERDKGEAIRLVEAALKVEPDMPIALILRAKLHLHYDEIDDAIRLLQRAARLDPFDYKTQSQLAGAYKLRAEQLGDELTGLPALAAWHDCRDLLGSRPAAPVSIWTAARTAQREVLVQRADEHQKAADKVKETLTKLTHLSRQAGMEPWNAQLRFEIAEIWMGLDRPSMTRMWLNATLICDPEHAGARAALRKLAEQGNRPL